MISKTPSGILVYCYSDWTAEKFSRAPMRIIEGKRTDYPIRKPLPPDWAEGVDYYVKLDPDFDGGIYSRCHREIRDRASPGDVLLFRTNHRGTPYLVGGMVIGRKEEGGKGPILVANEVAVADYRLPITEELARELAPEKMLVSAGRTLAERVNYSLGFRGYLRLPIETAEELFEQMQGLSAAKQI